MFTANPQVTPTIDIVRDGMKLSSVSIVMPTWEQKHEDNQIYINIPLLGLETVAMDEDDAYIAVEEALKAFCIASDECGLGLESELEFIGWTKNKNTNQKLMAK